MPTLATALLQGLKDHGAREMFGIPGDFVLPFFKVIDVLQGDRRERRPALLYLQPRAGGRFRRRRGRTLSLRDRRRGGDLRRRRLQHRQCHLRRLRGALAGGADRRGAGRERADQRLHAAPSGALGGYAVRGAARSHLRPGSADRSRDRAGRERARPAQRARAFAAGLYRAAARYGGRRLRCRAGAATHAGRSRGAARMRRRDRHASVGSAARRDHRRRRDPPLRSRGAGGRARAQAQAAGGDDLHGAGTARARARRHGRHLFRHGGRPSHHAAGRRRGCAAAARRDRLGHQFRPLTARPRPAACDAGDRLRGASAITAIATCRSMR
jgi:hypothetical protein